MRATRLDRPQHPAATDPGSLPERHFSTAGLPPREQFDAWRDRLSPWMDVTPLQDPANGFRAEHRTWQFGPLAMTWSSGERLRNRRDPARIRRDHLDHWMIVLTRHGHFLYQNGEDTVLVNESNLVLYGMQMPNLSERSEAEWIMAFIPRDALPEIAPAFDALLGRTLDTALGGILRAYLDQLAIQLPRMTLAEAPRAVEATLALLRAAITGSAGHCVAARPQLQAVMRSQVTALIRAHLGSARLDPTRLSRLAGVSRSRLYRLFEPEGGVARTILRERLQAIGRALADPTDRRGIGRIADEHGMPDPSAFSRAFRQEFGMSPREFRESALTAGAALPPGTRPGVRALDALFRQ